jgi:predicted P-loop ATPase
LLTDPTGSRRFICIEVTGTIDTNKAIDYEQLYAQAMYELDHGERYWFDQSEEQIMTRSNREFEQVSLEEQLFYRYFRPAKEKENGEWLSTGGDFGRYKEKQCHTVVKQAGKCVRASSP